MAKKNGAKDDSVQLIKRDLLTKLTDAEVQKKGEELAALEIDVEKRKAVRTKHTRKINDVCKEISALSKIIDEGEEKRITPCKVVMDFAANVKRTIRTDTNEEVDKVAMTAEDRQPSLPA